MQRERLSTGPCTAGHNTARPDGPAMLQWRGKANTLPHGPRRRAGKAVRRRN